MVLSEQKSESKSVQFVEPLSYDKTKTILPAFQFADEAVVERLNPEYALLKPVAE